MGNAGKQGADHNTDANEQPLECFPGQTTTTYKNLESSTSTRSHKHRHDPTLPSVCSLGQTTQATDNLQMLQSLPPLLCVMGDRHCR